MESKFEQLNSEQKLKVLAQKYKEINLKYKETSQELIKLKTQNSDPSLNIPNNNLNTTSEMDNFKVQYCMELAKKVVTIQYLAQQTKDENASEIIAQFIQSVNEDLDRLLKSTFDPQNSSFLIKEKSIQDENEMIALKEQVGDLEQKVSRLKNQVFFFEYSLLKKLI